MEQKLSRSKIDKKRFIRELTFRSLYAVEIGSCEADDQLFEMISKDVSSRDQKQYTIDDYEKVQIRRRLKDIADKKSDLDTVISAFLVGWKMDRLPVVDLCILRLSVYDLLYNSEVPRNVVISEAVLLAEAFTDDKDKKFINGVLSSVVKKFDENDGSTEKLICAIKNINSNDE